ncbi:MAG TPA: hypothetical protein VNO32_12840 [Candidatus Acidoferrum sp.]|jgi:hypothetical protein|nr:hypothetical protein [Candidatus Acidoferrum sp.]
MKFRRVIRQVVGALLDRGPPISNPRLSLPELVALERLQREEEQEQMALFQPTPEELRAAVELRTQAEVSASS